MLGNRNFCFQFLFLAGHVRLDVKMDNITRYKNQNLRIRCEITGYPVPKYEWYKDEVVLRDDKDRVSIKLTPWGSRSVSGSCFESVLL